MKRDREHRANIGKVGEDTACRFLMKQGFSVIDRNYRQKWGEIDIIAQKRGVTRFVEVKTVSRDLSVSHETLSDGYRPEDNVHFRKLERLSRTIQTYLLEKDMKGDWQFDVVTVFLDTEHKLAKVHFMENIVL